MVTDQIILECKRVKFYGPYDKDAFFEWLNKIKSIISIEGKGDSILIYVSRKKVSNHDLHDIMGLFRRYKINLKQLEAFLNDNDISLFNSYKYGYSICVYPTKK